MLTFKAASLDLAGSYKIKATNSSGSIEHTFQITVEAAPYVIRNLADKISVKENEEITFDCEIGGVPAPKISWTKKGEEIIENELMRLLSDETNRKYGINMKATQGDAGVYTLLASNKVGKVTLKTEVSVLGKLKILLISAYNNHTNLFSFKAAPKFIRKLIDTQVVEKRITKLEVEILATPKPTVEWYKNGVKLEGDERITSHDAKGGVYQLLIKNSRKDDGGVYICKAINEIGSVECTAHLDIEMAPQFLKKLEKLEAVEDCEVDWFFQVNGIPRPKITFNRNNNLVELETEQNKKFYELKSLDDNVYCLHFINVRKLDEGNWSCLAANSAGTVSCVNKLETVPLTAPKFIEGLKDSRIPENQNNRIVVKIQGVPFPQIEWFFGDKQLIPGQSSKYKFERDVYYGTFTLTINDCQPDTDSGLYKARISNRGGECTTEGVYTVKGFAPRFVDKPEKIYALANQVASFATVIEADPKPLVTWFKGRNQLDDSKDIRISSDEGINAYFMEIQNCKQKDAATYLVSATNEFGTETCSVTLIITTNPEEVPDYKTLLMKR